MLQCASEECFPNLYANANVYSKTRNYFKIFYRTLCIVHNSQVTDDEKMFYRGDSVELLTWLCVLRTVYTVIRRESMIGEAAAAGR